MGYYQVKGGQGATQAQGDEDPSSRMAMGWLCVFGVQHKVCSH